MTRALAMARAVALVLVGPAACGNAKAIPSEVEHGLKRIYEGARDYYDDVPRGVHREHMIPLPPFTRQFPTSASVTPPAGACCRDKCAPDPNLWRTPSWSALKFSMDSPHRYSYEFISEGKGVEAKFTVRAIGDVDCDGVYSTFELIGEVNAEEYTRSMGAITRINELE